MMAGRPSVVALVRAVSAAFFFAVAAYCFLAYSPFAYELFIKPSVLPALTDFVTVSPWLFWVMLLLTVLTLMPELRARPRRARAWAYVVVGVVVGAIVLLRPPLAAVGNTWKAYALGIAALVPPVWLSVLDHLIWPAPAVRDGDPPRALTASVLAAVIVCAAYAAIAPFRAADPAGAGLPASTIVAGMGVSLACDVYVFTAVFLAILGVLRASTLAGARPAAQYWLLMALLAACVLFVLYFLVATAIAFTGRDAWVTSTAMAIAAATVWADFARLRAQRTAPLDPVALFVSPVARARAAGAAVAALAAIASWVVVAAIEQFDWNFLLQKLSVLAVWLVMFAAAYAWVGERRSRAIPGRLLVAMPLLVFVIFHVAVVASARTLDAYAVVDPSFRLVRDLREMHSAETASYYGVLRAHTLLAPGQMHRPSIDFVQPLEPVPGRKPLIFLIVVDSLRRDYLSAYNPRATFTPRIGELAADSFVYRRAFTRYSGTGLAVPAIWAGGMLPHMAADQPAFAARDTLLKLLNANDYVRLMDLDSVIEPIVPRDGRLVELDAAKKTMDFDLCGTLDEAGRRLPSNRPAFFYSLPQNVHIAVSMKRPVPDGESYPAPFVARVASAVHRIDACIGRFVEDLKREHLYDDSIIILTADHGDSLGEEGRWGHAYVMYPEVMQIPLIVHVPPRLASRVQTDLDGVVFSTDIVPSLYALLGYDPADRGPLFGRSFFTAPDTAAGWRRRQPFLLASSYGPVYGMLRHNGRELYVVDAVDGREYAFDLAGAPRRVDVTPAMAAANRELIAGQLASLAAAYGITIPQ